MSRKRKLQGKHAKILRKAWGEALADPEVRRGVGQEKRPKPDPVGRKRRVVKPERW